MTIKHFYVYLHTYKAAKSFCSFKEQHQLKLADLNILFFLDIPFLNEILNYDETPFYVGKGQRKRAFDFNNRGPSWNMLVEQNPMSVPNVKIFYVKSEFEAFLLEEKLIFILRNKLNLWLANLSSGGEGTSGYIHTIEAINKIRQASINMHTTRDEVTRAEIFRKIAISNTGKTPSKESREKNADKHRGIKQSEETKNKRAIRHKGRKNTPETIEKMRQSALRRTNVYRHTEETKRKIGEASKKQIPYIRTPEIIAKQLASKKIVISPKKGKPGSKHTEDTKLKMTLSQKLRREKENFLKQKELTCHSPNTTASPSSTK